MREWTYVSQTLISFLQEDLRDHLREGRMGKEERRVFREEKRSAKEEKRGGGKGGDDLRSRLDKKKVSYFGCGF